MAYSYGCVMVRLPELLAEEIRSYGASIPTQYLKTGNEDAPSGLSKEIHTTVKYGLMEEDPVRVAEVIAGTEPIMVTLGRASIFHNENQAVLKLGIESPGLRALHNKLCSNLRHVNTYRDFRPHVTVAYLVKRDDDPYYYRQFFDDSFVGRQFEVRQLEFSAASGLKCQISIDGEVFYGGCEMRQEAAELVKIAKSLMARDRMSDMDPMAMERIGSMYMEIAKWTTKTAMGRPSTAPIVVQLLESQNKVAERIKGKGGLTGRAAVEAMIHAMSGLYTIDAPPLRRLWRKYGDDVEQMLRDANIL